MADAHVLILEDDPIWQQNVIETLQPIAAGSCWPMATSLPSCRR